MALNTFVNRLQGSEWRIKRDIPIVAFSTFPIDDPVNHTLDVIAFCYDIKEDPSGYHSHYTAKIEKIYCNYSDNGLEYGYYYKDYRGQTQYQWIYKGQDFRGQWWDGENVNHIIFGQYEWSEEVNNRLLAWLSSWCYEQPDETSRIVTIVRASTEGSPIDDIKWEKTLITGVHTLDQVNHYYAKDYDIPELTAENERFLGWYTNEALKVRVRTGDALAEYKVETGEIITKSIVGLWVEKYAVLYHTDRGDVPSFVIKYEDDVFTEEDLPRLTSSGWEFIGWFDEDDNPITAGMVVGNIRDLYAKWESLTPTPPVPPNESKLIDDNPVLTGNRHKEHFIFKKVEWGNYQEHGSYDYITEGEIEQAADTELKMVCSLKFEGYEIPDVNDLIRIYYVFNDDDNVEFKHALGTFFVSYADVSYVDTIGGMKASGKLSGLSVLSVLKNVLSGAPVTIKAGSNAVYTASQICRSYGLNVNAEPSSFALGFDHTFEAGVSILEVVNWLLEAASFLPAFPDEMGVVQMLSLDTYNLRDYDTEALYPYPSIYPEEKLFPAGEDNRRGYYFANDDKSIMLPEVAQSSNWQTTPNVVRLLYNLDDACIVAYALNEEGSKASLANRGGREITYFKEVSNLGSGDKRQLMYDMAVRILKELSTDIEVVQFKHAYVPLLIYDPVSIKFSDLEWTGKLDNIVIDLSPSAECQTKIKRVIEQDIRISSGAEVLRQ